MATHVTFVGPDLFSAYIDLCRGLKEVGARVTGIGHTPRERLDPRLRHYLDDYRRVPSATDAGALVAAVRAVARQRPVDLLETGDEALVLPVAEARAALGLPGLSVQAATLCRDKPAMKAALRAAGLPCAESAAVGSLAEASAFAERVGFPLVLKPRAALGGLGTYRVDGAAELAAAGRALRLDRGETAAVEEFVEGHEGFYDTLSVDGEPVHELVSHYYPNVLPALDDRTVAPQIAVTNRVALTAYDELRRVGRQVIAALGIGTAATHMEWFFGPKGLKISEIGARPPGERIFDLYTAGNDLDLWREWAMVIVHRRPGGRLSRRYATGSVQVRPDRDGRIAGYRGLREVLGRIRPAIVGYRLPAVGTPTDPIYKGYLNNVWFRLRHPDYDELCRLMSFVGENLRVTAA